MQQVNMFLKGLKNTLDPILNDSQTWTFPTEFIRVLNVDGHGMVATFLKGNTDPNKLYGEEYELSQGFHYVGSTCIEDITFIFSVNTTTGEGEVGCYPAPDQTGDGSSTDKVFTGYASGIKKYLPLCNYKPTTLTDDFRTTLFTFLDSAKNIYPILSCENRKDYDNSVNIYFVDHHNPDRVINCGFDIDTGISNNRIYTSSNFGNIINLIPISSSLTNIDMTDVITGGNLAYGNYFVFIRYLTSNFDRTAFVAQTRAISVYDNTWTLANAQGGMFNENSDKKIVLNITNIDTDYPYYELAFIRYYSDISNPIQYETKLVDQYFDTTNTTPAINDYNNVTDLTLAEIVSEQTSETVSKSIIGIENRLFRANLKSQKEHRDVLTEFAKRICPFVRVEQVNGDFTYPTDLSDDADEMQYKDYNLTYSDDGYFGGEIYAFTAKYVFTNGLVSDAYPIRGIDNSDGTILALSDYADIDATPTPGVIAAPENVYGIYRFPMRDADDTTGLGPYNIYERGNVRILELTLDYTYAKDYLNALGTDDETWFKANIASVIICRAERRKMLEYQGLALSMATNQSLAKSYDDRTTDCAITESAVLYDCLGGGTIYEPGMWGADPNNVYQDINYWGLHNYYYYPTADMTTPLLAPLYRGYLPMAQNNDGDFSVCYLARAGLVQNFYGIYSPDMLFNENGTVDNITHVKRIAKTLTDTPDDRWDRYDMLSNLYYNPHDQLDIINIGYILDPLATQTCNTKNIGKETEYLPTTGVNTFEGIACINKALGTGQMTDYNNSFVMHEYSVGLEQGLIFNRSFYLTPYIALKQTDGNSSHESNNLDIVNLYNRDTNISANDFISYYNINAINYFEISNKLLLDYDSGTYQLDVAGGDCFVQRVFFKQQYWTATNIILDGNTVPVGYNWSGVGSYSVPDTYGAPNDNPHYYAHGKILSIITENAINNAMRFDNSKNSNSYFPLNNTDTYWGVKPSLGAWLETFFINSGFNVTLSHRFSQAFNTFIPYNTNKYPTRIRHSAEHQIGSFIDGFRIWNVDAYQDYDINNGEIIEIIEYLKNLISVQLFSINQHYTNEKAQRADITTGQMIVGIGSVLAKEAKQLADYGSQHQCSIVKTDRGIYGIDFKRKLIWGLGGVATQSGNMMLQVRNISQEKEVDTWVKEFIDTYSTVYGLNEFNGKLGDNPYGAVGLVSGYDPQYEEVLFTFLKRNLTLTNRSATCEFYISTEMDDDGTLTHSYVWTSGKTFAKSSICIYTDPTDPTIKGWYYSLIANNINHIPSIAITYWTKIDINLFTTLVSPRYINPFDMFYDCSKGYLVIAENKYNLGMPTLAGYTVINGIDDIKKTRTDGTETRLNYLDITCICDEGETLVYSEKLGQFTSVYPYAPYQWYNINNDLLSVIPVDYYNTGKIYKHNQLEILTFWQRNKVAIISWIVNGLSEKDNSQPLQKMFNSYQIVCSGVTQTNIQLLFDTVTYSDDHQYSTQDFITTTDYWRDPEWLENKWNVPIDVSSINGVEYLTDSSFVGSYLKVSLSYKEKEVGYIKQIITNFEISFS